MVHVAGAGSMSSLSNLIKVFNEQVAGLSERRHGSFSGCEAEQLWLRKWSGWVRSVVSGGPTYKTMSLTARILFLTCRKTTKFNFLWRRTQWTPRSCWSVRGMKGGGQLWACRRILLLFSSFSPTCVLLLFYGDDLFSFFLLSRSELESIGLKINHRRRDRGCSSFPPLGNWWLPTRGGFWCSFKQMRGPSCLAMTLFLLYL